MALWMLSPRKAEREGVFVLKNHKIMKRMLAVMLTLVMLLSLAACAGEKTEFSLDDCGAFLLESIPEPTYGSVSGEWAAFGLARWGGDVPREWFDRYYEAVEEYVTACEGVLDQRKYTEYARVILALTAIGKDPSDVAGYDLVLPLADYEQTIFQGINGPVFALLALDCGPYEIPENPAANTQATREMYVAYILDQELPGGGWSLAGGEAEIDITAMALQALAKYADRQDVAGAVERAVTLLSQQQNENGGYTDYEAESSETVSQVIVALTELGISVDDPRFVKNGNTLKDRLLDFLTEDNGFRHVPEGKTDLIATEQAFYALVALQRAEQGQCSLYDMTDVE